MLIDTSPVDQIPVGFTVPTVRPLLSTYVIAPTLLDDDPAAIVVIEFEELVNVVEPAPRRASPEALIAAVCVTELDAVIDSVLDVAVTAEFNATTPP